MIFATMGTIGGVATFLAPLTVGAIADLSGSFLPGLALFATLAWSLGIVGFLPRETGTTASEARLSTN